jgi:hypothetical protein
MTDSGSQRYQRLATPVVKPRNRSFRLAKGSLSPSPFLQPVGAQSETAPRSQRRAGAFEAGSGRLKDERVGRPNDRRLDDSEMAPQATEIAQNGLGNDAAGSRSPGQSITACAAASWREGGVAADFGERMSASNGKAQSAMRVMNRKSFE